MSQRPTFAWHELTTLINDHTPAKQEVYDRGLEIHHRLESIIGNFKLVEQELTYDDPELPFIIKYHPDVIRQELRLDGSVQTRVYDIKSMTDFLKHRMYCLVQISGYAHFLGAVSADFILYWRVTEQDPNALAISIFPADIIPWEDVKQLALRTYALKG